VVLDETRARSASGTRSAVGGNQEATQGAEVMRYTIQPFVPDRPAIVPMSADTINEAFKLAKAYLALNRDAVCVIKNDANPYALTVAVLAGRDVRGVAA